MAATPGFSISARRIWRSEPMHCFRRRFEQRLARPRGEKPRTVQKSASGCAMPMKPVAEFIHEEADARRVVPIIVGRVPDLSSPRSAPAFPPCRNSRGGGAGETLFELN